MVAEAGDLHRGYRHGASRAVREIPRPYVQKATNSAPIWEWTDGGGTHGDMLSAVV
jgi:hypothetical protein